MNSFFCEKPLYFLVIGLSVVHFGLLTKSDDRAAGFRFVYHEYDYRPNWTTRSPVTNYSEKLQTSRREKIAKLCDNGKMYIKKLTKDS